MEWEGWQRRLWYLTKNRKDRATFALRSVSYPVDFKLSACPFYKAPPMAKAQSQPVNASDVQDDYASAIESCDELLRKIVTSGRTKASKEELLCFSTTAEWDEKRVAAELRRMRQVVRLEAIAGTPADRQAAESEAEAAAQILQSEGPAISEQIQKLQPEGPGVSEEIQKLQARLRTLERDAAQSAARVEDYSHAVESLRVRAPVHIQSRARQVLAEVHAGPMATRVQLEARRDQMVSQMEAAESTNCDTKEVSAINEAIEKAKAEERDALEAAMKALDYYALG